MGNERVSATYSGRVPETRADIDLLLAIRPRWWEYWLYAGALRVGLDALEGKFLDYEMGFAPPTGETHFGRDAFKFLRTVPARALNMLKLQRNLSLKFQYAQRVAADVRENVVRQIHEFVAECVEAMNSLPELTEGHSEDDEPLELTLVIELTVDEESSKRNRHRQRAQAADHELPAPLRFPRQPQPRQPGHSADSAAAISTRASGAPTQ